MGRGGIGPRHTKPGWEARCAVREERVGGLASDTDSEVAKSCRSPSSRDHSKHLPAFVRLPFLAGQFNEVGIATGASRLTVSCEFAYRPEWAAFGQGTSGFSSFHFFPELV